MQEISLDCLNAPILNYKTTLVCFRLMPVFGRPNRLKKERKRNHLNF